MVLPQKSPPSSSSPSPCAQYCIPPLPFVPSCYLPNLCYPPSCPTGPPPQIYYPTATPCIPQSCAPPPTCCPQTVCCPSPPKSCSPRPQCRRKSGCCGGGGCGGNNNCNSCCSGPKSIVCVPIQVQAQACMQVACRGNGVNRNQRRIAGRSTKRHARESGVGKQNDKQQASYNNCNFYITGIPKELCDKFGLGFRGGEETGTDEDGQESEEITDETSEDLSSYGDDQEDDEYEDCADENVNAVGYGGKESLKQCLPQQMMCCNPWAAFFPGCMASCFPFPMCGPGGFPFGMCGPGAMGGGMFGRGGGLGPGMRGRGRGGGGPFTGRGGRGRGGLGRGGPGRGFRDPYESGGYNEPGRGRSGDPYGRDRGYNDNQEAGYNDGRERGNNNGLGRDDDKFGGGKNKDDVSYKPSTRSLKKGATSKIFKKMSGYRPYPYSNAELTKKSEAYLPDPSRHTLKSASCSTVAASATKQNSHIITKASSIKQASTTNKLYPRTTRSESSIVDTEGNNMSSITRGRSKDVRRGSQDDDDNLIPVYRTTTQTSLQIIERANEPSEIRVIQKPVQEVVSYQRLPPTKEKSRINLDVVTEDVNKNRPEAKPKHRKKRPFDPCHPRRTCMQYHTRRLHRLCSFANRRKRRLSQIHKPVFCLKEPPCPIRETVGSILRKWPPARCRFHVAEKVPAFHEYCPTDACPDTNRYPLLTRELSPLCHEYYGNKEGALEDSKNKNDHQPGTSAEAHASHQKQSHVKRRGKKRKISDSC